MPVFLKLDDGQTWVLTTILPWKELSICRLVYLNQSQIQLTLLEQTRDRIRLCVRHGEDSVELEYRLASCEEVVDLIFMPMVDVRLDDDAVCGCVIG